MNAIKNNNLSKIEKVMLVMSIIAVIGIKLFFNVISYGTIFLIVVIFLTSVRKNNNTSANYLVKEKLELIVRHYFFLCILWNVLFSIFFSNFEYFGDSLNIIIYAILLVIFLLPFSGVLKAIQKISKINLNKDIELYRELPENINPAIIAYLMQEKILDRSDISATLLDLVRRGYLQIQNNKYSFQDIAGGILDKKLVVIKNIDSLKEYEKFLINWFSRTSDNNSIIDIGKLKDMLKTSKTLKEDYDTWERLVKKEADKLNFYDDQSMLSKFSKVSIKISKLLGILSLIMLIIFIVGCISEYLGLFSEAFYIVAAISFLIHMALSILAIIIYDLRLPIEYLNKVGSEKIRKWNGFIKFLKEFSIIDKRKAEEVYIWEEYLVYGVAFGISKETIDTMNDAYGLNSYISN